MRRNIRTLLMGRAWAGNALAAFLWVAPASAQQPPDAPAEVTGQDTVEDGSTSEGGLAPQADAAPQAPASTGSGAESNIPKPDTDGPKTETDTETFSKDPPPPIEPETAPPSLQQNAEEITVTGSWIKRSNLTTPVPLSLIDAQDIDLSGETDLSNLVQELPALFNSVTSQQSVDNNDTSDRISAGLALLDLRDLGTKRTLVLVNGRRHVGGRAGDTAVDINTIPAALVERVEVITGGSSAVYGADAVSGVVNFVLKKDFEGISARVQQGLSGQGDGSRTFLSLVSGLNFDKRKGNITVALQYGRESSITFGDRGFSRNNGIANDYDNPDLFIQAGESSDPAQVGQIKDPTPDVPASAIRRRGTFAISSRHGRIAPDINSDGIGDLPGQFGSREFFTDVNNNGINDLRETVLGRGVPTDDPDRGYGSLVYDGDSDRLRLFEQGVIAGQSNQFGGDGIADTLNFAEMFPSTQRFVANSTFRYDLSSAMAFFAEAKFVYSQTEINASINTFNDFLPVKVDNPYMPASLRDALLAVQQPFTEFANPQLVITRDQTDLGTGGSKIDRTTLRLVTGLEGDLPNGWSYNVAVNFGRTRELQTLRNQRVEDRWYAALDAVDDPRTAEVDPICRSDLAPEIERLRQVEAEGQLSPEETVLLARLRELNPEAPPVYTATPRPAIPRGFYTFQAGDGQCKPLNLFGAGAISPQAIDFVTVDDEREEIIEQQVVSALLTGDSSTYFELPYGPIGFAAGLEYRREFSEALPSALNRDQFIFASGDQPLEGSYNVIEGFAEVAIPVLEDLPGARLLSVEGALRVSEYSTVGTTVTTQARGTYAPTVDMSFRGTLSRAVRAPNVSELFQPLEVGFFRPRDPCDENRIDGGPNPANRRRNCREAGIQSGFIDPNTSRFEGLQGGNDELQEEVADTITVGLVLTPRWVPDLALTLDYWDIDLTDAIEFPTAQDIVNSCYDAASLDNKFCRDLERDPNTQGLSFLRRRQQNIASKRARGWDFTAGYRLVPGDWFDTDWGTFDIGFGGTYLYRRFDVRVVNDPTSKDPERGELGRPIWATNTNLRWSYEGLVLNWQTRWQAGQFLGGVEREDGNEFLPSKSSDVWVHDLGLSYSLLDRFEVFGGVNNLTDRKPIITEANFPVSGLGRYFFAGVRGQLE